MEKVFNQVKADLKKQLEPRDFERWIKPLLFKPSSENVLNVQVPNIFFKTWIEENYGAEIRRILSQITGREIQLNYTIKKHAQNSSSPNTEIIYESDISETVKLDHGLNEKYTFSNFVVGNCNKLAHVASLAVASGNASYNPLYIYGGAGLGKTHLLCAIGNTLLKRDREHRVAFISSEGFSNEMMEAMNTDQMSYFRKKYRNIDTLLVDDVHYFGEQEKAQEEFFYTFNALYDANKQIALAGDKTPKQIPNLKKKLLSRLEGGLFVDISPPDQETMIKILMQKAREINLNISVEAANYIASRNESNIRVLGGYLTRLKAYSDLTGESITVETIQKVLGRFFETGRKQVTLDQILRITAGFFNVKVSDLKSGKKQQVIAAPRQVAMHLARKLTTMSTVEIGRRIGGRDHSTVIHADKKVKGRKKKDRVFSRTLFELEETIRNSVDKL